MSYFYNNKVEPRVHLPDSHMTEHNQEYFRYDYLSEVLSIQKNINQKLVNSIDTINRRTESNHAIQQKHKNEVTSKITEQNEITKQLTSHIEKLERAFNEKIALLEREKQDIIALAEKKEQLLNEQLLANLNKQDQTNNLIMERIDEIQKTNNSSKTQITDEINQISIKLTGQVKQELENITGKYNEQVKQQNQTQNELTKKIDDQTALNQSVLERLEFQEALTHKINRQLDSLKSVIYERISHLVELIDNSANHTIRTLSGRLFKNSEINKEKEIENNHHNNPYVEV